MGRVPDFDIVVFGATGFTGALTAEYLADHAPEGLRWALAGRSPAKLEAVRDRLTAIDEGLADLDLLHADIGDAASLADVASRTRVVITTVGPYLQFGEPLVAACAAAGTDYVDLTGEAEFIDRMCAGPPRDRGRLRRADRARVRLRLHPHDLGVFFTVPLLPPDQPLTVRGVVRAGGSPSGGTFAHGHGGHGRGSARRARRTPPGARPSADRSAARREPSPASRTGTHSSATGCCRCPPSTR